jgi:nitroreductase
MIKEVMTTRRSVRRFKPDALSAAQVEELIEMAITAPSASNKQPWRFFVTDERSIIDQMAAEVQLAVDRIVEHVPPDYRDVIEAYGSYFVRFQAAPVVLVAAFRELVVLSNLVDEGLDPDDSRRIREMEIQSGLASTAMAVQNLLLFAHSIGLGASCMSGPLVAEEKIRSIMGIPPTWKVAVVVPIGYPDEEPEAPGRKSISAVTRWVKGE